MKSKAFTLIELLVVIAIIGLLASIVLVGLKGARGRARDAKRISEIRQIRTALELYYAKYGRYPTDNEWSGDCSGGGNEACNGYIGDMDSDGTVDIDDALAEVIEGVPPADPLWDGNWDYAYYYDHRHCCNPLPENCQVTIHVQTMESLDAGPGTSCNDEDSEYCDNPCDCGGEGQGHVAHYLIPIAPCD